MDRFIVGGFLQIFGSYTVQTFHAFVIITHRQAQTHTEIFDLGIANAPRWSQAQISVPELHIPPEYHLGLSENILAVEV